MYSTLLGCEELLNAMALHAKADTRKTLVVITTIETTVIILSEELGAAFWVGDGVVLECCGTRPIFGYKHYAHAAATHHTI